MIHEVSAPVPVATIVADSESDEVSRLILVLRTF